MFTVTQTVHVITFWTSTESRWRTDITRQTDLQTPPLPTGTEVEHAEDKSLLTTGGHCYCLTVFATCGTFTDVCTEDLRKGTGETR